jgi:hypothetical protein
MKQIIVYLATFHVGLFVLFWTIVVLAGYVFDAVHSYGGPTPMSLDTAICLSLLAVAVILLSMSRLKGRLV